MPDESSQEEAYDGTVGVTIPVNVTIEGKHRILDFSELEQVLRNAKVISQGECGCRKDRGDDACMPPMNGCFGIDEYARKGIEEMGERSITVEEALEAMRETYDAGLVHVVYTFKGNEEPNIVCSCCTCCCELLGVAAKVGYEDRIFESRYISTHDIDKCQNCGTCVDRCQFNARTLSDGKLVFDRGKCFGCGVCVKTCPAGAIDMAER
ncbi:MAG: hypothetical protein AYK23_04020 [Candidatus Proteinoplasmatales archaeon SG8-5]|nr:MAG: hypothetical protein AYK23_04020 [Candidatus Proteinoplasmatales archaeon SG8-5]